MNKSINILKFTLLKLRTGLAYAGLKTIFFIFQVDMMVNFIKELNTVQLEIIPLSIIRERNKQASAQMPTKPSQEDIDKKVDEIFGAGDTIRPLCKTCNKNPVEDYSAFCKSCMDKNNKL